MKYHNLVLALIALAATLLPPAPCREVVLTRHDLMAEVLVNKPQRACTAEEPCDGYLAPYDCRLLDRTYLLVYNGGQYTMRTADCSVWSSWHPKLERQPDWFGDVAFNDRSLHLSVNAPKRATLCLVQEREEGRE